MRRESAAQPEYSVLPPQPDARYPQPQAMQLEPQAMQMQAPDMQMQATASAEVRKSLPAGTQHNGEGGFATVQVFYATDRMRGPLSLSDYEITGQKQVVQLIAIASIALFLFALLNWLRGRTRTGGLAALMGGGAACIAAAFISMGQANIEKHGVTYSGDRGTLVRGICEVTVPDSHQRGLVERPSLLKFELHEDQRDHIVLTSAIELAETDFHQRLSETVAQSSDQVFVGFHSWLQRWLRSGGAAHRS
ncbi:membrane protein, partial [Rhodopirellula maiorica SM1]